jgi:5-methyltetrahydropteroyltriglutamate--homocysteine methyltransferase
MTLAANLGFPRIGAKRELKKATETYWKGDTDAAALTARAAELKARNWQLQKEAGIDVIPSNDFSFYDQVLDMAATVGAVPPRFGHEGRDIDLDTYFAMARGTDRTPAMEMTKWFDTNYHYIVPEFHAGQHFSLSSRKAIDEFNEAKAQGVHTRPVLIGPVTFLSLGKARDKDVAPLSLLEALLPVYRELLDALAQAGADWVQIDEPMLALDLDEAQRRAFSTAYESLAGSGLNLLVATYFEGLRDNLELAAGLPVQGLHIDLVRAPDQLESVLEALGDDKVLSLGVIDGRNVWRADLAETFTPVERAVDALGRERVQVAPSCSLLHTPVDLDNETKLDAELKSWLAFAKQKLGEVAALAAAARSSRSAHSVMSLSQWGQRAMCNSGGRRPCMLSRAPVDATRRRRRSPPGARPRRAPGPGSPARADRRPLVRRGW